MTYSGLAVGLADELYAALRNSTTQYNLCFTASVSVREASHLLNHQTFHLLIADLEYLRDKRQTEWLSGIRRISFIPVIILSDAPERDLGGMIQLGADICISGRCPCSTIANLTYNGPPVKTTPRKKCVNQDLEILILSRPEPPLKRPDHRRVSRREAGSLDRAAMACYNGRPRGRTHNLILTSPRPRRHRFNRPSAFCQGRRKAARSRTDKRPPAFRNPALHGAAGCCNR